MTSSKLRTRFQGLLAAMFQGSFGGYGFAFQPWPNLSLQRS